MLGDNAFRVQAEVLAAEAVSHLYAGPMWRTHPGEDRYDAVDGVGMLFLALVYLDRARPRWHGVWVLSRISFWVAGGSLDC